MTAKRFENRLNKNNIKFNTQNPVWDNEKQDAFNVFEMIDLLNEQHEQIQELIQSRKELEEDCQSTFNAMSRKQADLYRKNFKLKEENE